MLWVFCVRFSFLWHSYYSLFSGAHKRLIYQGNRNVTWRWHAQCKYPNMVNTIKIIPCALPLSFDILVHLLNPPNTIIWNLMLVWVKMSTNCKTYYLRTNLPLPPPFCNVFIGGDVKLLHTVYTVTPCSTLHSFTHLLPEIRNEDTE